MFDTIAMVITEILKAAWEIIGTIAYYCADSFWEG